MFLSLFSERKWWKKSNFETDTKSA